MLFKPSHSFFRWTFLRSWFPILYFVVFWIHALLAYSFGFVATEPLHFWTYFYLIISMAAVIMGYNQGLGNPRCVLVPDYDYVVLINKPELRRTMFWLIIGLIGAVGLVLGILLTGASSFEKAMEETENVRSEIGYSLGPVTFISMLFQMWLGFGLCRYWLAKSVGYRLPWVATIIVYVIYALMCMQSFLSANRGNFLTVFALIAFGLLYVHGVRIRELVFSVRWMLFRAVVIVFVIIAFSYFFFISRHRGGEGGARSIATRMESVDRYGLYQWFPAEKEDIGAFLALYGYFSSGGAFENTDYFLQRGYPLFFEPTMLLGGHLWRQISRFFPGEYKFMPTIASQIGRRWRQESDRLSVYTWPSVWGWSVVMFGYVGAVIFFWLFGRFVGFCSGEFLRYGNLGALMVCYGCFGSLIRSFNGWGGDINHQMCIWFGIGVMMMIKKRRKRMRI